MHWPAAAADLAELSSAARTPMPILGTLGWGVAVALAMSTQLLVQPFVWRNFGWGEIASGWAELAGERLAVSLPIALAIALGSRIPVRTAGRRAGVLGAATPNAERHCVMHRRLLGLGTRSRQSSAFEAVIEAHALSYELGVV